MLIGLAVFFFTASLIQLGYLHWRMAQTSPIDLVEARKILTASQSTTEVEKRETALLLMRGHSSETTSFTLRYTLGR
jgi:hypothetical protein